MIIAASNGKFFDTEKDLSAPERHILQKLFAWESTVTSQEQFEQKKEEALTHSLSANPASFSPNNNSGLRNPWFHNSWKSQERCAQLSETT
jgi:hypothetical protein